MIPLAVQDLFFQIREINFADRRVRNNQRKKRRPHTHTLYNKKSDNTRENCRSPISTEIGIKSCMTNSHRSKKN